MENIIQVRDLRYKYPANSEDTLVIPEFSVQKGERVFLYGPSGSGKTTLLEIFAGVLKADSGEVTIAEQNLTALSEQKRDQFRAAHIGYIFQSFNLIPYLSVRENIELPVHLQAGTKTKFSKSDLEATIHHLCQRLGIEEFLDKKVTALSVGQQQRVAVARALCGKPDLILADEPTSSLDTDRRERFLQLLFELCEQVGSTVLFVSHDRTIQSLFSRTVSLESINKVAHAKNQAQVQP